MGWPVEHFGGTNLDMPFDDMKERMLFAEAIESVKCYDEGVLRSVPEANIGSIFGIGFPPWTGVSCSTSTGTPAVRWFRRSCARTRRPLRRSLHSTSLAGGPG